MMKNILTNVLQIALFFLFLVLLDAAIEQLELTQYAFIRIFNVPIFFLMQQLVYRLLRITDVLSDGFIVLVGFVIAAAFPYHGLSLELLWIFVGAVLTYAGAKLYDKRKQLVK